jgi:hypothetical protein
MRLRRGGAARGKARPAQHKAGLSNPLAVALKVGGPRQPRCSVRVPALASGRRRRGPSFTSETRSKACIDAAAWCGPRGCASAELLRKRGSDTLIHLRINAPPPTFGQLDHAQDACENPQNGRCYAVPHLSNVCRMDPDAASRRTWHRGTSTSWCSAIIQVIRIEFVIRFDKTRDRFKLI